MIARAALPSGTARGPVLESLRQRINLICCKRTIIFVRGESCNQDECGCHQSSDPPWTQLAPDGNAVARGASVRLARGRSGRKRRSRRLLTLFLPGSHGTGWSSDYSPDYSHLAILRRSRQSGRRQVRSTIRCRWIALRFAWHRERTGADRCRASARERLSIRVRQRVRTSPSDPFADLKRRAPVARPIRAGGCPVRAPCRARPAQAPGTAAGARPPAARRTPSGRR